MPPPLFIGLLNISLRCYCGAMPCRVSSVVFSSVLWSACCCKLRAVSLKERIFQDRRMVDDLSNKGFFALLWWWKWLFLLLGMQRSRIMDWSWYYIASCVHWSALGYYSSLRFFSQNFKKVFGCNDWAGRGRNRQGRCHTCLMANFQVFGYTCFLSCIYGI